jgi:hypothetical protein
MEALKQNKVLVGMFVIVCIAFGFYIFGGNKDVVSPLLTSVDTSNSGQNIVSLLAQVEQARIDTTLFSSSLWNTLKDYSIPIPDTAPGKTDIFAPVGNTNNTSVSVATTTKKIR